MRRLKKLLLNLLLLLLLFDSSMISSIQLWRDPGGLSPYPLPRKDKSAPFLLVRSAYNHHLT